MMNSPVRCLALSKLVVKREVQVRADGLVETRVREFMEILSNGGELPPIHAFHDGNAYILVDGFHRIEAHKRLRLTTIYVEVTKGDYDAALDYAETANLEHGLPLTFKDKKNLLERRFRRNHEWVRYSNGKIAGLLGVNPRTIKNWVDEFATMKKFIVERNETEGKDGRTRKTGGIGKKKAIEAIREKSNLSITPPASAPEAKTTPPPILPDHVSMSALDKGGDAPIIADDLTTARLRLAQIRPAVHQLTEGADKVMQTYHVGVLNQYLPLDERKALVVAMLRSVERQIQLLQEMVPCLPREWLIEMKGAFANTHNAEFALADLIENRIREMGR